jgi:4'-phosphopantetheinyl transferase
MLEEIAICQTPRRLATRTMDSQACRLLYLDWPSYPQILARIEIRATSSGAPEAIICRSRHANGDSITHRAGNAMCTVSGARVMLGCDLEVVEPRSHDFVVDYFTAEEQSWVARTPSTEKQRW